MKKNIIRRATAVGLSLLMVGSFVGCNEEPIDLSAGDVNDLPAEITVMADTIITEENGFKDVAAEYEAKTGIKMSIEKPDHAKYYEKVTLSFASEQPADIIEVGSTYYPELANSGALWDMTDAWNNTTSNCKNIVDESYVDALKIDGKLYGFPMAAGNGTCTYVRQDWLKEAGLDVPTNYDEFINMLTAFKNRGGGTIPLTAAGLIQTETPYDIYLREFYQDATPDFYYDSDKGEYVDGFAESNMRDALMRLRQAYQAGLIDAEVVTNKTSTCRDKVGQGLVGAFNYWAGMWCKKLNKSMKEGNGRGEFVAIPAIEETGGYTERVPTAMAMSVFADKKGATFEHFIMYSHDGGEGQMLFTHGVEDKHYTVDEKDANGNITKATPLGYYSDPSTPVEKSFYAPELSITDWNDPVEIEDQVKDSLATFRSNRVFASVPIVTDAISENLADLNVVKGVVVANAVTKYKNGEKTDDEAVDEAIKYYEDKGTYYASAILDDLNSEDSLASAREAYANK